MKPFGHGEKFTRRMERAIVALIEQPTVSAAARDAGVGTVTLGRWMKRPDFQERYREARGQILDSTVLRLQNASGEAVEALRRALGCGSPPAEIKAAEVLLTQLFRIVETKVGAAGELQKLLAVPPVKTVLYEGEPGPTGADSKLDLSKLSDLELQNFKALAVKAAPTNG